MDTSPERARATGRAVGAVLAGGRGRRLGAAKATALLGGRPLISYPLAAVEAAGLEPLVVAKRDSPLPPLDCTKIEEPDSPRHPLCGIVAALRHAGGRPVVAIGCDMPFVPPALLAHLAAAHEPLLAMAADGEPQPFPARYEPRLLPALEAALAEARPLRQTVESLAPRLLGADELSACGDPQRLAFNVNTPADLEEAEALLALKRR